MKWIAVVLVVIGVATGADTLRIEKTDRVGRKIENEYFIAAIRSRKVEDLHCDIAEGHLSTTLAHLATISCRLGRKLVFNPDTETITGDAEANRLLTREYRKPYALPDKV